MEKDVVAAPCLSTPGQPLFHQKWRGGDKLSRPDVTDHRATSASDDSGDYPLRIRRDWPVDGHADVHTMVLGWCCQNAATNRGRELSVLPFLACSHTSSRTSPRRPGIVADSHPVHHAASCATDPGGGGPVANPRSELGLHRGRPIVAR